MGTTPDTTWATPTAEETATVNSVIAFSLSGNDAGWKTFSDAVAALDPKDDKLTALLAKYDGYQFQLAYTGAATAGDAACVIAADAGALCVTTTDATTATIKRLAAATYQADIGSASALTGNSNGTAYEKLQVPVVTTAFASYAGTYSAFVPIETASNEVRWTKGSKVKGATYISTTWAEQEEVELKGAISLAAAAAVAAASALAF